MVLNYHLAKHHLDLISPTDLDRLLRENNGYQGCLDILWERIQTIGNIILRIPNFTLRPCSQTFDGVNMALSSGPVLLKTRSLSQCRGRPAKCSHWVVAISQSCDGAFAILDPSGRTNFADYGKEIRDCQISSSSPVFAAAGLEGLGDGEPPDLSALRVFSNSEQMPLTLRDDIGRVTGLVPESEIPAAEIPGSRAGLEGGLDAHDGSEDSSDIYYSVDVYAPEASLFLLTLHALTSEPYLVRVEGYNSSMERAQIELAGTLDVGASRSVAVFFSSGSTGPVDGSLSMTPLSVQGPVVASLRGEQRSSVLLDGAQQALAFAGILWPQAVGDWRLHSLSFENVGNGDASRLLGGAELFLDSDEDRHLSEGDTLLGNVGRFGTDQQLLVSLTEDLTGPVGFFLVVDKAVTPQQASVLLPGSSLVVLLIIGILVLRKGPRSAQPLACAFVVGVLLHGCDSGGKGGSNQGPPNLQLSLTGVDAIDLSTFDALGVDGLPTEAWSFAFLTEE